MTFTNEQLEKYARFHTAWLQADGVPVLNHEFAQANGLTREDLKFIACFREDLEKAAYAANVIGVAVGA